MNGDSDQDDAKNTGNDVHDNCDRKSSSDDDNNSDVIMICNMLFVISIQEVHTAAFDA